MEKLNNLDQKLVADPEKILSDLLDDPRNSFLTDRPEARAYFDSAPVEEAIARALSLISQRRERTLSMKLLSGIEGVEVVSVNAENIQAVVDLIRKNQILVGEGGDAIVVMDKNEIENLPPVICYKFFTQEKIARGRNSVQGEAQIQSDAYEALRAVPGLRITTPKPFYALEIGSDKIIAMEKLPAQSVDDLVHGRGVVPEWLDVDVFCRHLSIAIETLHAKSLYHRDMHLGNVMVSQAKEEPGPEDPIGYIIDYGLSGYDHSGIEPYRKELAGSVFTYDEDNAIINEVKVALNKTRLLQGAHNNGGL